MKSPKILKLAGCVQPYPRTKFADAKPIHGTVIRVMRRWQPTLGLTGAGRQKANGPAAKSTAQREANIILPLPSALD